MTRGFVILLMLALFLSGCYGAASRKRNAQLEYEKGMRLYNRCDFLAAKKAFEHSLWLNPKHEGSKLYLNVVRRILGDTEPYPWEVEELEKTYGRGPKDD